MKNWSRLILPLGLGGLAMVINASAMHNRLATVTLVAIGRNYEAGQRLEESDLVPVEFSYPSSHLQNHFWGWEERESLLQQLGTPVRLSKGDLIPRNAYRELGRTGLDIPDEHVLIGIRFGDSVIRPEDHRLLIPGRAVNVQFSDDPRVFGPYRIAFLEPVEIRKKNTVVGRGYQMGVFVVTDAEEELRKLTSSRVNSLIGLAE